ELRPAALPRAAQPGARSESRRYRRPAKRLRATRRRQWRTPSWSASSLRSSSRGGPYTPSVAVGSRAATASFFMGEFRTERCLGALDLSPEDALFAPCDEHERQQQQPEDDED